MRRAWYAASVRACAEAYDGQLVLRVGDPRKVVPAVAREVGAQAVHVTRESTPSVVGATRRSRGRCRTGIFASSRPALPMPSGRVWSSSRTVLPIRSSHPSGRPGATTAGRPRRERRRILLSRTSNRIVRHGRSSTTPCRSRACRRCPSRGGGGLYGSGASSSMVSFAAYDTDRDRPDRPGTCNSRPTSRSGDPPGTLLADLAGRRDRAADTFVSELAWREFYADVLWHNPSSAWRDLKPTLGGLAYDEADDPSRRGGRADRLPDRRRRDASVARDRLDAQPGQDDHGELPHRDLHVVADRRRHFLDHLVDGDPRPTVTAGSGSPARGPMPRPTSASSTRSRRAKKFDPDGAYVRRWVPELAHLTGAAAHEPWTRDDGYAAGYCQRIVDHAQERVDAWPRLAAAKGRVTR